MQEGDLADGPLPDILRLLAAARATGGVHVRRRDERGESADAVLFLREGRLYAATAPGPRPLLGVRLVAAGAVTREALEEALESQAGELAGWRLGELLVHLGYVDGEIVAEFVVEQILDTVAEVSAWVAGGWRFRRGEKTREADGLSLDIEDVLERVIERRQSWNDLEEYAGGATAVPVRVEVDEALTAQQIPLAQALLGEVDGVRTLAELATRCGLTTYEAGYVLAQLVEVGAVRLAPREETAAPEHHPAPVAKIVAAAAAQLPLATAPAAPAPAAEQVAPVTPVAAPDAAAPEVVFDAEDPLGLADLLGTGRLDPVLLGASAEPTPDDHPVPLVTAEPAPAEQLVAPGATAETAQTADTAETARPAPQPAPASSDDDLAALFGSDDGDLGAQLAVLARQAEEARWAAEARRRDEVRARRADTLAQVTAEPVPDAVVETPVEPTAPAPYVPIGLVPLPGEPPLPPVVDEAADEVADEAAVPVADLVGFPTEVATETDPATGPDLSDAPGDAPDEPIGLAPIETFGLSLAGEAEAADDSLLGFEVGAAVGLADAAEVAEVAEVDLTEAQATSARAPLDVAAPTGVEPIDAPVDTPVLEGGLQARIPRLPTRSVHAAPDPIEDDLPGALANLRGAIDLEALDAPEPVENAWPAMGGATPAAPGHAPAWASAGEPSDADRNELQSALSVFGTDEPPYGGVPTEDTAWADAGPATAWNPDEAHDFTPDDEQPSTDTAALLRELSFLGLEDMPAPPRAPTPPRPPTPRQAPVPAGKAKRKSIFGR